MPRLITEWSTDDPQIAEVLRMIASQPEGSVAREELEGALHMFQARLAWRAADEIRRTTDGRRARRPTPQSRRPATQPEPQD